MFKNPGKVLRGILILVFILGCIASILAAVLVSDAQSYSPHPNGFLVFMVLVGGVVASYLSLLLGLCFAELVENSTKIYRILDKLSKSGQGSISSTPSQQIKQNKMKQNNKAWICPKCGSSIPKYITTCKCGEPRPSDDNLPKRIAIHIKCHVCNFENDPGSEFCGNCGNKLR